MPKVIKTKCKEFTKLEFYGENPDCLPEANFIFSEINGFISTHKDDGGSHLIFISGEIKVYFETLCVRNNGPYVLESIVSTNTMVLYKVISAYDEKISDTNIFIVYMITDDYIKPNEVYIYEHALNAILEKTEQMVLDTIANTKPNKEGDAKQLMIIC